MSWQFLDDSVVSSPEPWRTSKMERLLAQESANDSYVVHLFPARTETNPVFPARSETNPVVVAASAARRALTEPFRIPRPRRNPARRGTEFEGEGGGALDAMLDQADADVDEHWKSKTEKQKQKHKKVRHKTSKIKIYLQKMQTKRKHGSSSPSPSSFLSPSPPDLIPSSDSPGIEEEEEEEEEEEGGAQMEVELVKQTLQEKAWAEGKTSPVTEAVGSEERAPEHSPEMIEKQSKRMLSVMEHKSDVRLVPYTQGVVDAPEPVLEPVPAVVVVVAAPAAATYETDGTDRETSTQGDAVLEHEQEAEVEQVEEVDSDTDGEHIEYADQTKQTDQVDSDTDGEQQQPRLCSPSPLALAPHAGPSISEAAARRHMLRVHMQLSLAAWRKALQRKRILQIAEAGTLWVRQALLFRRWVRGARVSRGVSVLQIRRDLRIQRETLEGWARQAALTQRVRDLKADIRWRVLSQAFGAWRVVRDYCVEAAAVVRAAQERRIRRIGLSNWRQQLRFSQSLRAFWASMALSTVTRVFLSWQETALRSKDIRQHVAAQSTSRLKRRALRGWVRVWQTKCLEARGAAHHLNRAVMEGVRRWRVMVERARASRVQEEAGQVHYEWRAAQTAVRRWRAYATGTRADHFRAVEHFEVSGLRRGVLALTSLLRRGKAVELYRRNALRRFFVWWRTGPFRDHVLCLRRDRAALCEVQMRRALRQWSGSAVGRRNTRQLNHHARWHLVRSTVATWKAFVASRRLRGSQLVVADSFAAEAAKQRAVEKLKTQATDARAYAHRRTVAMRKGLRALKVQCVAGRSELRIQRAVFIAWNECARSLRAREARVSEWARKKHASLALQVWVARLVARRTQRCALLQWHRRAQTRLERRDKMVLASRKWDLRVATHAFRAWRLALCCEDFTRDPARHNIAHLRVRDLWLLWRHKTLVRSATRQAESSRHTRMLRDAVTRWRAFTIASVHKSSQRFVSKVHWARATTGRVWGAWNEALRLSRLEAAATGYHDSYTLRTHFEAWVDTAASFRTAVDCMQMTACQFKLRAIFTRWLRCVRRKRNVLAVENFLGRREHAKSMLIKSRVFSAWSLQQRRVVRLQKTALVHYNANDRIKRGLSCLRAWRRLALIRSRGRKLAYAVWRVRFLAQRRTRATVFAHWRTVASSSAEARARADALYARRLQGRIFVKIQTQLIFKRFLVTQLYRKQWHTVRSVFHDWSSETLEQRALAFRVEGAVRRWAGFVVERQRSRVGVYAGVKFANRLALQRGVRAWRMHTLHRTRLRTQHARWGWMADKQHIESVTALYLYKWRAALAVQRQDKRDTRDKMVVAVQRWKQFTRRRVILAVLAKFLAAMHRKRVIKRFYRAWRDSIERLEELEPLRIRVADRHRLRVTRLMLNTWQRGFLINRKKLALRSIATRHRRYTRCKSVLTTWLAFLQRGRRTRELGAKADVLRVQREQRVVARVWQGWRARCASVEETEHTALLFDSFRVVRKATGLWRSALRMVRRESALDTKSRAFRTKTVLRRGFAVYRAVFLQQRQESKRVLGVLLAHGRQIGKGADADVRRAVVQLGPRVQRMFELAQAANRRAVVHHSRRVLARCWYAWRVQSPQDTTSHSSHEQEQEPEKEEEKEEEENRARHYSTRRWFYRWRDAYLVGNRVASPENDVDEGDEEMVQLGAEAHRVLLLRKVLFKWMAALVAARRI